MMVALGPKTNVVLVTTMAPFGLRVSQPDESRRFCRARLCRAFYALFNVCVFEFCIFFPLSWLIFHVWEQLGTTKDRFGCSWGTQGHFGRYSMHT